jgi:hypothetical protein
MVTVGSELCSYVYRNNGIHEFVLADASKAAVDQWLEQLNALYVHASLDEIMLVLADVRRSRMQSMVFAFRRIEKWLAEHPQRPATHYAFLSHPDVVRAIKATFMTLVRSSGESDMARFFSIDRREQAVAWLRATR